MITHVSKDARAILDFKRKPNSPANADCPSVLARFDFLQASARRELVVTQKFLQSRSNRKLVHLIQTTIGFGKATKSLKFCNAQNHLSDAFQLRYKFLNIVKRLAFGFLEVRVMFSDGPP